jgi:hypothetical protein
MLVSSRRSGTATVSDKYHITMINPEAGDHAIPQNARDIRLALRAANVAWERFPYLEHRYGERGKRFTDSDGCWLFALASAKGIAVTKELEWLRTLLASRGIPTVILEFHLRAIGAEIGAQSGAESQFDHFLLDMEIERRRLLGAENYLRLIDTFDRRFRACEGFKFEPVAELLISAWIDEQSGISGSVSALRDWLVDVERFSSAWIANVNDLFAEIDRMRT